MDCTQLIQLLQNLQTSRNWIDILTALLTPIIAISAVGIAIMQWRTNRNRLKNELFDRRYVHFVAIRDFLASIFVSGTVSTEATMKLHHETKGLRFVFDETISNFLVEKIKKPVNLLESLNRELECLRNQEERKKNLERQRDIKNQLEKEFDNLEMIFARYLHLRH